MVVLFWGNRAGTAATILDIHWIRRTPATNCTHQTLPAQDQPSTGLEPLRQLSQALFHRLGAAKSHVSRCINGAWGAEQYSSPNVIRRSFTKYASIRVGSPSLSSRICSELHALSAVEIEPLTSPGTSDRYAMEASVCVRLPKWLKVRFYTYACTTRR